MLPNPKIKVIVYCCQAKFCLPKHSSVKVRSYFFLPSAAFLIRKKGKLVMEIILEVFSSAKLSYLQTLCNIHLLS